MDDDAAIAMGGNGDGQRDELTSLFVKFAGLVVGGAKRLISTDGVRAELHKLANSGAELFVVFIPIKHHERVSSPRVLSLRAALFRKYIAQERFMLEQPRFSADLLSCQFGCAFRTSRALWYVFWFAKTHGNRLVRRRRRGFPTGSSRKPGRICIHEEFVQRSGCSCWRQGDRI